MNRIIEPGSLKGCVKIPPSKSLSHRAVLAAALAEGESVIENLVFSEDIEATCDAIEALGITVTRGKNSVKIHGRSKLAAPSQPINCRESGSTLRFLIPFASLVEGPVVFKGEGKLVTRPLDPYFDLFEEQNVRYCYEGSLPLMVDGNFQAGTFKLPGNVSSQFVSGLLFVLPLLEGHSEIILTSELESKDYVDLTIQILERFGVVIETVTPEHYKISGGQHYRPEKYRVEGDYSQSAFWIAAGLMGTGLQLEDIVSETRQGDRRILDIVNDMQGKMQWNNGILTVHPSHTIGAVIDASQCPDLVPILATLASVSDGQTHIINAGRVRIKESDRLTAIATELNKMGADVKEEPEGLVINGVGELSGGLVEGWNDHRIVMALAVASIRCSQPVTIQGSEAVKKSYPHFFEDFKALGGKVCEK